MVARRPWLRVRFVCARIAAWIRTHLIPCTRLMWTFLSLSGTPILRVLWATWTTSRTRWWTGRWRAFPSVALIRAQTVATTLVTIEPPFRVTFRRITTIPPFLPYQLCQWAKVAKAKSRRHCPLRNHSVRSPLPSLPKPNYANKMLSKTTIMIFTNQANGSKPKVTQHLS